MKGLLWKFLGLALVFYSIVAGFLMDAPDHLPTVESSIRNLYYHVPMWFTMIILLFVSFVDGILFLNNEDPRLDSRASSFIKVAMLFGLIGLATGSFWARFTWTAWWVNDPKLNGAAIAMFIYTAYYILRYSIEDEVKMRKLTTVYSLFAFPLFIALIIVYPKMAESSLHPGSGDTVGFDNFDLDNNMRMVFYPAVLGWILIGCWVATLKYRLTEIKRKNEEL